MYKKEKIDVEKEAVSESAIVRFENGPDLATLTCLDGSNSFNF
jgi:hypothetical protein